MPARPSAHPPRVRNDMRTRVVSAVLLAFTLACSPLPAPDAGVPDASTPDSGRSDAGAVNSQETYAYAGCDDAGTYGCPRSLVFACALDTIERRHASCQAASDCVLVSPPNCFGHWVCRPAAVNDAGLASFLAEANLEIDRYCDGGLCRGAPSCVFSYVSADCLNGTCVARREDGGL